MKNWQKVLEKIKHHSNKLSQRYLTFSGKATILNTLILAKTTFLSNIFPIPENVLTKLHKYIFSYICQNRNVEPISRKTLFLKKEQGGLNIKETEAHNLAMRLKHLLNLKQHPKQPPWMYLATYWLAKDIYNYNKEFHYLRNNNRAKTTNKEAPFYYKDLVQYIKYQNTNITKLKNETKITYKNILHQGSQNYVVYGETMWKNEIPNLDFTKIWTNTNYSYSQTHTSDLLYRLLHYVTTTNKYIFTISRDKKNLTPNCDFCNITEDNLHLFIKCNRIQNIWKYYHATYQKLTKQQDTPQEHILKLSSNNISSKCKKLILTLTQIIIYEIWQSRNNLKYDNVQLSQNTIINKINSQIKFIVNTHCKLHKEQDSLDQFQTNFCINNAIAQLNDNKLLIKV